MDEQPSAGFAPDEPQEASAEWEDRQDDAEATNEQEQEQEPEPDWQGLAAERYDRLLRLQADFDNFRRRVDREREELRGQVTGAVLSDLLPVYDNLERAVKFMPNDGEAKAWRMGVEMTLKGFDEVLARLGVTPIATVGQPFNPRVHEAVQRVDSGEPEGIVVEELLKGFQWKERVLRASLVKVSTGNPPQPES